MAVERPIAVSRTTSSDGAHDLGADRGRSDRGVERLGGDWAGAEFRLPLLIDILGSAALQVVILNKAVSLIVVLTALPARLIAVSIASTLVGGPLLGVVPAVLIVPALAALLVVSAVKAWRHE